MHVLLMLLGVAVLAILFYRTFVASAATPRDDAPASARPSQRGFAFLANGLLFYRPRGGEVTQLQSAYVQESIDRRERLRGRHGWKQGTSFGIAAGGGMRNFDADEQPVVATAAAFDAAGDLLYFLKDASVGGLFRREASSGTEHRLLLKQNLHLVDLNMSPDGTRLAASSQQSAGVANIALFASDGSSYREVTGGDSIDTAPAWVPGSPATLLFQSCGLARDEQGYVIAQGNARIEMIDLDSGEIATVLDDPNFDFMRPRVCPAGKLHFIRRPFEAPAYSAGSFVTDTLLFPFRLLRAVFHYLNFFSLMYTRKPLTSANGPAVKADLKQILLQGKRIDADKALRNERPVHGVPSLVPASWQLISRTRDGVETVLACNVAAYDLGPDGTVVYSNGRGVFILEKDGSAGLASKDELVSEVVAAAA